MRAPKLVLLLAGIMLSLPALAADSDRWNLPVEVKKLDNGLTVVVSEDHSSPTVGVSVVYHVGMRLEPRNRTGFAHLFEHLMFEGTPNAPEGVFDKVITAQSGPLEVIAYIEEKKVVAPKLDNRITDPQGRILADNVDIEQYWAESGRKEYSMDKNKTFRYAGTLKSDGRFAAKRIE